VFDVVVVGGGPAGLAVSGALRRKGRSVAVFERSSYEAPRVGETLGAEALAALRTLGAWDRMAPLVEEQVPLRAVQSAWGAEELHERHSMVHPLGEGRHVDRARFDASLATWAEGEGVVVGRDAGTCTVKRTAEGFRVESAHGESAIARYFVDASGRGAPAGAGLDGRRWLALDRQVAIVSRLRGARELGWELLLEAVEDGYWYAVPQPDGVMVVALVTDADLALEGGRAALSDRFTAALGRTRHISGRCAGLMPEASPRIVRADSGCLMPGHGNGWRAVGDAAFATDPLAGNGVARALRGAAEAAERIDAELSGRAGEPGRTPEVRLAEYLDRRASYYALEARWPDSLFWARRRPVAWREAEITLAPTAHLRPADVASPAALARAEALVPHRAIATTLASVHAPTPAHVLLAALRESAPLGDKRLLVGLQLLVDAGALAPA
jgi:flavin-dependent dehydrogenase